MRLSRNISILLLAGMLLSSCIDRYFLDSVKESQAKLVVDAHLNNYDSVQAILLSRTVSVDNPVFKPVSGCKVDVINQKGDIYNFIEVIDRPGYYASEPNMKEFTLNTGYTLRIVTPEGDEYESDNEIMLPCPEIDSIEYEIKSIPTYDPEVNIEGVQFYVDLNSSEDFTRFYRWELFESWEYHSTWPIRDYIDENEIYHAGVADYSKFICYRTIRVNELFVLSTKGLTYNRYDKFELHFVDNLTEKLYYRYSLLLKQFAITEKAYNYWNTLVKNQQESGGLFETQPLNVPGNIKCISDSTKKAIGYFSISAVKAKRIFIYEVPGLNFEIKKCDAIIIEGPIPLDPRPLYFVMAKDRNGDLALGYGNPECFDCTLLGGSTELPDIWKDENE